MVSRCRAAARKPRRRLSGWASTGCFYPTAKTSSETCSLSSGCWPELPHRLGLGTGVINPVTRHPAVTAAAIASVQLESGWRAVLGVGHGDSSLAQLGLARPSTVRLAEFVGQVRGFLHGETVTVDGQASRIGWITDRAVSPVPVELAATGPGHHCGGCGHRRSHHADGGSRPSARRLGDPDGPAGPYRGWAGPGYAASGRLRQRRLPPRPGSRPGYGPRQLGDFARFSAMSAGAGAALGRDDAAVIGQVGRR
jgi:5,10-methylenetetrahydromethanopterin reductase